MEDAVINGVTMRELAVNLGFNSHVHLLKAIKQDPFVEERYQSARIMSCYSLESDIPSLVQQYPDPQQARVQLECHKAALAFRNPTVYGQRVDVNLTQTLDLTRVIDAANNRITLDVSPVKLNKPSDFGDLE